METARKLGEMLRRREVSATEVLDSHLARIAEHNPRLNAIVTLTEDIARKQATLADEAARRGEFLGPLHGIPVAHKDLQETAGIRTTFGSLVFADYVPDFDTSVVRRIREAGAVCIGKTNTPEFGAGSQTFNSVFGATRNPYNDQLTCGGSSGGAAVALATGMVALADGSDTGGSLRNPASFCGVVGLRTTPGLVPIEPNRYPEGILTVNGPMARNCGDASLLLSVQSGRPEPDLERDFRGVRVAWSSGLPGVPFEGEVLRVAEGVVRRLEAIGCEVEEDQIDFSGADEAFRTFRAQEFHILHRDKFPEHRDTIKATIREEVERGAKLTPADLSRSQELRRTLLERASRFHERYEFFVLPTVQVLPFPVEQPYVTSINGMELNSYIDWMRSCYYVSMLGAPALSLPAGLSSSGLPVGVQIVGKPGQDWAVLQLGHALEAVD